MGKLGSQGKKRLFVLGFQHPAHVQQVVASVKKAVDEVRAALVTTITIFKRDWNITVDEPPLESFSLLTSSSSNVSHVSKVPITSTPTFQNLFFSPEANVWVVPDADVDAKVGRRRKNRVFVKKNDEVGRRKKKVNEDDGVEQFNFVFWAESLYLVANFYQFLISR